MDKNNLDPLHEDPVFRALVQDAGDHDEERRLLLEAIERAADTASFLDESTLDRYAELIDRPTDPLQSHPKKLGSYVLWEKIGQGGFSQIFKGYHQDQPDVPIAIKAFNNHWLDSISRLEVEAFVLRKLQHPNLVRALDAGCDQGIDYLVLNLIEGTSLDKYLETTRLDFDSLSRLFSIVARALAYAHEQEVVHRDLKPNNIMITSAGQPVVTDFGLARRLDPERIKQSMTATGALIGTLGYLAPEQATGNKNEITRATDIYGLGATMYFALTGQPPLARDNLLQALLELKQKQPDPPRNINPEIPLDLQLICLKCLEKSPPDRYESMHDLANDLQCFLDRKPISARPVHWTAHFRRWSKANPLIALLSIGLLTAIVSGFFVALFFWSRANHRWHQSKEMLIQANSILRHGDRSAEQMLAATSGSLEYRYERLKQAIRFREQLASLTQTHDEGQRDMAVTRFMLGKVCMRRGLYQEGHENYLIAHELFHDAASKNLSDSQLQFDLFHSLLGLDHSSGELGLLENNREHLLVEQALKIIEKLVEKFPENIDYLDALACTLAMSSGRIMRHDPACGLDHLVRANRIAGELKAKLDQPCLHWRHAGGTALRLSWYHLEKGNIDQAESWSNIAYEAVEEFLTRPERDPQELMDLAECFRNKFRIERAKGNLKEAEKWKDKWVTNMTAWSKVYPDFFVFTDVLAQKDEVFR